MYSLYANNNQIVYGIQKYILDTEEELQYLPTNKKPGTQAYVIETSNIYMLNHSNNWVKVQNVGGNIIWENY